MIIKIIYIAIVLNPKDSLLAKKLVAATSFPWPQQKYSARYSMVGISVESHSIDMQVRFWLALSLADQNMLF